MRWLAWDWGNETRDEAMEFTSVRFVNHPRLESCGPDYAQSVAEMFAETRWDTSDAFESVAVIVVQIEDDGSEVQRKFDVSVDFSPEFIAEETNSDA